MNPATGLRRGGARTWALACVALVAAVAVATAVGAPAPTPAPPSGAELARLSAPPVRGPLASQRIYFVMTDRYANGDQSNDGGGKAGARTVTGFDPADAGWFHGGDFAGLRGSCTGAADGLARIADLGFTAVWITPPFGQRTVQGDSAGYHGYWITDFTAPDRHLGTEQEFAALVTCAHSLGLKVILDVVVNHTGDVVSLTGGSGGYIGPEQVPYRDCRGKPFRPARYIGKPFPCMAARFMPRVPLVAAADRAAKKPAWLNDSTRYHDRGDIDFSSCNTTCIEQGDFFGLDDLFTEREDVVRGLADVYAAWIERYEIDGIRIDTARHVDAAFFERWLPRIQTTARRAGVRDFLVFGEVFNADTLELIPFVRDRGLPTLLDFPLQDQLVGFAAGERGARGIASVLADDDYFQSANGVTYTPPTFLGNHDMGRVGLLLRQRSGSEATLLRRDLLAHSLLYLLRGAPVVYYGDEVGMTGAGGDKLARQDMFPTRVAEWRTEPRVGSPAIDNGSSFDVRDHPVGTRIRELAALRKAHPALAYGPMAIRLADGPRLIVSRFDLGARREYVTAFNAGTARASVTVQTATPGAGWDTLLGAAQTVRSTAAGRLTLSLAPLEAAVLRAHADLPARAPVRPALVVRADELTNLVQARARVATQEPVSVAFAVKRGGGAWRRIAADQSPPFRGFLDPPRFRRGERVHVLALARWPDGRTTLSPVVAVVPRPR